MSRRADRRGLPAAPTTAARGRAPLALALALATGAALAQPMHGRWEGLAQVPGQPTPVALDLIEGSAVPKALLTLPGRSAAVVLPAVTLRDGWLEARADAEPAANALGLRLRLPAVDGQLTGELLQGGHRAAVQLLRTGAPQPAPAPPGQALAAELHGVWRGRYDLGFGPREATLKLSATEATMRVVGPRSFDAPFDEAVQVGAFMRLRSSATGLALDAPSAGAAQGQLQARVRLGPFEAALALTREVAR